MGFGVGIILLVIGLILVTGAVDLPQPSTTPSPPTPSAGSASSSGSSRWCSPLATMRRARHHVSRNAATTDGGGRGTP